MADIVVRPVLDEELETVGRLRWRWGTGDESGAGSEEFVRSFAAWAHENKATHRCLVVLRGETVIGMAWLAVTPRVPHPGALRRASGDLQSVYVVPEERGAGLGGRLIDAVLAAAGDLGLERVVVHSSERAVPAYSRSGFAVSRQLLQARPAAN